MNISWIGDTCFRIQTKEGVVCIDPFTKQEKGATMPKTECAVLLSSTKKPQTDQIKGEPFIIDSPGEYSARGIDVVAIPVWRDTKEGKEHGQSLAFIITADEVTVCHLGHIGTSLGSSDVEAIGDIDVLLTPIGCSPLTTIKIASENIQNIEPRMAIPYFSMNCSKNEKKELQESFAKEMGISMNDVQDKVSINATSLPQDDMEVTILSPVVK